MKMKMMKMKRVVSKGLGVVMGDRIPSIFHDWWTRASRVVRWHVTLTCALPRGLDVGPYSRLYIYQINQGLFQGRHLLESAIIRMQ